MSVRSPLSEPFLRTEDAAHYISVSRHTLEKHRALGTGPQYHKVGRRIVYTVAALREWAARSRRATAGSAIAIIPPAKPPGAGTEPGARRTLLATPAAAHLLRLSARTLEKHRRHGTGPAYSRINGRVFYALADLMTFTDERAARKAGRGRLGGRRAVPARKHAAKSDGGPR